MDINIDKCGLQEEEMGSDITITTILTYRAILDTSLAMTRRPRVFAPGLLYHLIVRGNQRRKTFRFGDDYKAYLHRLEHTTERQVPP